MEATAEGRAPLTPFAHTLPSHTTRTQPVSRSHPFSHTLVHQTCSPSLHCMACPKQPVLAAPGTLRLHSDTNHTKYHTHNVCTMHHAPPCLAALPRTLQDRATGETPEQSIVNGGWWWWLKQRHGPALKSQRFYPMALSMSSTTVTVHTSLPLLQREALTVHALLRH